MRYPKNIFSKILSWIVALVIFFSGTVWAANMLLQHAPLTGVLVFCSTKTLTFQDILGYEDYTGKVRHFNLIPRSDPATLIPIPGDLQKTADLDRWIKAHFPLLEDIQQKTEIKRILDDNRYGATIADRKALRDRAGDMATVCNVLGVLSLPLVLILHWCAPAYAGLVLLAPIMGLFVTFRFKGLIRFLFSPSRSGYHTIWLIFVVPTFFALTNLADGTTVLSGTPYTLLCWIAAPILGIAILLVYGSSFFAMGDWGISLMVVAGTSWAFGYYLVRSTNHYMDASIPAKVDIVVSGKSESKKTRLFYVNIPNTLGLDTVEVDNDLYVRKSEGDTLHLAVHKGKWGARWYRLDDAP